jgi:hypothetical protein
MIIIDDYNLMWPKEFEVLQPDRRKEGNALVDLKHMDLCAAGALTTRCSGPLIRLG